MNQTIKGEYDELLQLVSFNLDEEEYGVDILSVREINKMMSITKIPNSPVYVEGVINLRGRIIPVVNLRSKMELTKKENDKHTRIIVVDINNKTIGFIVDRVSEVLRVPRTLMETPPEIVTDTQSKFITAVGKLEDRLLILLDLNKVFSADEYSVKETIN
ncbi:MAG: chemotaxis protein CheW [Ignavibacteriales bacterium]|nr:MAG: chemotaxis protein CheW [Ignavibacteriales bacterium]